MTRIWLGLFMMLGMVASSGLSFAETHAEHVNWGKWSFDWEVRDNTGWPFGTLRIGMSCLAKPACRWFGEVRQGAGVVESVHVVRVSCRKRLWSVSGSVALARPRADRQYGDQKSVWKHQLSRM